MRRVEIALCCQLARGDRRHDRVCVDLSVRMMQRHADFDAAIFERHHVLNFGYLTERAVPIGPYLDDELDVLEWKPAKTLPRILRENDDFAYAACRLRFD